MALPNDSFLRTADGSGATIATHLVNGKEYPVVIEAGNTGHIVGSLDTYMLVIPPHAPALNKIHFDLWNGSASNILKVRGAWVTAATDVANTATAGLRLNWMRTSAIGTAGTAATYNSATIGANITPKDTNNAALPANVNARDTPTGGATDAAFLFHTFHGVEELQVHANMQQMFNVLPNPDRGEQELTLRPSQGFTAKQPTSFTTGNIGFLITFTVE